MQPPTLADKPSICGGLPVASHGVLEELAAAQLKGFWLSRSSVQHVTLR